MEAGTSSRRHWVSRAIGFPPAAADEAWEVHEKLVQTVRQLLGYGDLGVIYSVWVIRGIVLIPILAPSASENEASLFDAAAFYIGGAIGFELIGGLFAESHGTRNW